MTAKKWLDYIEKQKRNNFKEQRDRQTYRPTDGVNEKNNRLLAMHGVNTTENNTILTTQMVNMYWHHTIVRRQANDEI